MESGSSITSIEQTYYAELFMNHTVVQVATKSGWQSDICNISCEQRKPGGLFVFKDGAKYFVPFDAIDHIKIIK